jgi:hypothetical protein
MRSKIQADLCHINVLLSATDFRIFPPDSESGLTFETQFVQQFDLEDEVHGQGTGARKSKRRRKVKNKVPKAIGNRFCG